MGPIAHLDGWGILLSLSIASLLIVGIILSAKAEQKKKNK